MFLCDKHGQCCPYKFWDSFQDMVKYLDGDPICEHLIEVAPVRHESWEPHGHKWRCTGCKVPINIDGTPEECGLKFCPSCGAIMDREDLQVYIG